MSGYSSLPLELRLMVAKFLDPKDLKRLIETDHSHHLLLTPLLHKLATQEYQGVTALFWAAYQGHEPLVKLLLKMGANINQQCTKGHTILHYAAFQGNPSMVKLLLENGADTNLRGPQEASALQIAVGLGTELFLSSLGPFCGTGTLGPGWCEEEEKRRLVVAELLLDYGAEVNYQSTLSRWSALHVAVLMQSEKVVRLLLENGADVGVVDCLGCTPLHTTASSYRSGGEGIAGALLEYGADMGARSTCGDTVLHWAAITKNVNMAKLFLVNGAEVYPRNGDGFTPIDYAMNEPLKVSGGWAVCGDNL